MVKNNWMDVRDCEILSATKYNPAGSNGACGSTNGSTNGAQNGAPIGASNGAQNGATKTTHRMSNGRTIHTSSNTVCFLKTKVAPKGKFKFFKRVNIFRFMLLC